MAELLCAAALLAAILAGGVRAEPIAPAELERPRRLIETMDSGPLAQRLRACRDGPFRRTRFAIGHRGAPLGYPEHTRESYLAAARQGAGVIECDVTFTRDRQLVCRHRPLHAAVRVSSPWGSCARCAAAGIA